MLLYDFSDRAEEYMRLAQLTHSPHDRELFVELARAWYGVEEPATAPAEKSQQTH
jgi:hypothetical protein